MFHVIPILKMPVHVNYFHRAIERVRHFSNGLTLYTKQEKCSYKPFFEGNIHTLMQEFPLEKSLV